MRTTARGIFLGPFFAFLVFGEGLGPSLPFVKPARFATESVRAASGFSTVELQALVVVVSVLSSFFFFLSVARV